MKSEIKSFGPNFFIKGRFLFQNKIVSAEVKLLKQNH